LAGFVMIKHILSVVRNMFPHKRVAGSWFKICDATASKICDATLLKGFRIKTWSSQ